MPMPLADAVGPSRMPSFPTPARVPATILARRLDWAALLARVFAIDVLRCSECGGRRRVLAFLTDRAVVAKILVHLGHPTHPPPPVAPARASPPEETRPGSERQPRSAPGMTGDPHRACYGPGTSTHVHDLAFHDRLLLLIA